MKNKIILLLIIVSVCLLSALVSYADNRPASSFEGPKLLREGDTLTVSYKIDNVESSGFEGRISYDNEKMTLVAVESFSETWNTEIMPSGLFLSYSKTPVIEESFFKGGTLFTLTFKLSENVPVGEIFKVEIYDVIAVVIHTDGTYEQNIPSASYEKELDPPASSDANLKELLVSGVYFSPAFSPDITSYDISMGVSFDVESLDISTSLSSPKATYEIIGNELKVGQNTVIIRVTAENGDQKEYSITVKRAHDPALNLSGDATISEIILSTGTLSPVFSPDIYSYIVFLPNDTKELTVAATPNSEFALDIPTQTVNLIQGNNIITVTCIAENSSQANYQINAYVMPEFSGNTPTISTKIPLKGSPEIMGTFEVGNKLTAVLTDAEEGSYRVEWYKKGKLVSDSADFTPSIEDAGAVIYAKFIAEDGYEGSYESIRLTIGNDGLLHETDSYITTAPVSEKSDPKYVLFGLIIIVAFFFFFGILIGRATKRTKNKDKKKNKKEEQKSTISEPIEDAKPSKESKKDKKSKKKEVHMLVNPYADADEVGNNNNENQATANEDKDANASTVTKTAEKTLVLPTTKAHSDVNTATTTDIISTIIDDDDLDDND